MILQDMEPDQLSKLEQSLSAEYAALASQGLQLDITRGKPCTDQVALADPLDGILQGNYTDRDGVDVRNYGGLTGLKETRELFASVLGSDPANTLIGGNGSLTLMYQVMDFAYHRGFRNSPWNQRGTPRFICPVPGYDRHFAICEHLGIDMVSVPMTGNGPDMDQVEALVKQDPDIVGMWCVPRFSNPTGEVYDEQTVQRIAALGNIAAEGFLVMWDNAYAVHALNADAAQLSDINRFCDELGTQESVFQFGSTSKVTFAGAGIAFAASGPDNLAEFCDHLGFLTIGPDKVNQLRHVKFLGDLEGIHQHMQKHAALLRPRFEAVLDTLEKELGGAGMGTWTRPGGGYFVSFDALPGLAREIVAMAAEIGVKLTPAGATWPYGQDPEDSNIRLAPTFAGLEDVKRAMQAFVVCVKLACVRQANSKNASE